MIKKSRKIILVVILCMIAVLGIQNIADAYYVGQSIMITYNQYESDENIFCAEQGQALEYANYYKIISHVKIEGNKSIDHNGKTIEHKDNAKFAAILSENNGESKDYGPVANSVWNFGSTWMRSVGKDHSGLYEGFFGDVKGANTYLDSSSSEYANNIDKIEMTDKTDKDNIKVIENEKNGKRYLKVGPFKWAFSGKLSEVKLYDQNNNEISGQTYSKYDGTKEVDLKLNEIKSEQEFYVDVPLNSNVNGISKISAKTDVEVKGVEIWFLESTVGYKQNLIIRDPYKINKNFELTVDYKIDFLGNLKVKKIDKTTKKPLENVEFKVKNADLQKYVKYDEARKVSYVDANDATIFKTGKDGIFTVKNIIIGNYEIIETKNPDTAYKILTEPTKVKVSKAKYNQAQILEKLEEITFGILKSDESVKASPEGRNNQNLSNNLYIKMLYKAILVRDVSDTENGFSDWVKALGNKKDEEIRAVVKGLVQSKEFKNKDITMQEDVEAYIKQLYKVILQRRNVSDVSWWLNKAYYNTYSAPKEIIIENEKTVGDLKIIKVNKNHQEMKLQNVGFFIQEERTKKYLKQNSDGSVTYVDNKEQATEFITDKNGEIFVRNLTVGTYIAYESKNPNKGYEIIKDGQKAEVTIDKTAELKILNEQKIKISGFVWIDRQASKKSIRNDLYKTDEHPEINDYSDDSDMLLDGITVRLKDKSGNIVKETKTSNGGKYVFEDLSETEIANYYVEFEYNGLTYTNVVAHINKDNGSKASESIAAREQFNNGFAAVEGKTENTGITKDTNGNSKHELSYSINQDKNIATLINDKMYPITANTNETSYKIIDHLVPGESEIKNINLGLYEREMPDLAIQNDIQNVKLTINGYEHVYNYSQRLKNEGEYKQDLFNVGVRFQNSNDTYTRAIYKADYEFENAIKDKELKVYITQKIALKNESTNLIGQINSFVDYFDRRYSVVKVGNAVDERGNVTGEINFTQSTYNEAYSKVIVNSNTKLNPQEYKEVYITFELNRDAVLNILNNKENLKNVVEINSYSIFDMNNKIYAGIDKDSNPGNTIPGSDNTTFEDDTRYSPSLVLVVADNAREMAGKVFLDSTSEELRIGEIRQGSGKYEDGEKGIAGVTVTLTEKTGTGKVYTATTDENGEFVISGFIPGDYIVTYTWGDDTYSVQKYKGTIYDSSRDQNNKYWYKVNSEERLSDAIDNYKLRETIDAEIKAGKYDTTKMNSATPILGIGVEYESTYTASNGDKYTYRINNIDFGIVERARQDIELRKRVSSLKLTLANGNEVLNLRIDENGKLEGSNSNVVYMRPSEMTNPKNGLIKIELDNELIQGATVEVVYEITAINNSEKDYLSENYYKYGIQEGNLMTITPEAVVDYLSEDFGFEANENKDWTIIGKDKLAELVVNEVYTSEYSTIANKKILYTESLKTALEPAQSKSVELKVSKLLSNEGDISLDNEAEIVKVDKDGGSKLTSTNGNYVPGTGKTEADDSMSETIIITPNTGANLNYILPIAVGVIALITLGAGVILIKKKVLSNK